MKCVVVSLLLLQMCLMFVNVVAWSGNIVSYSTCCYRYRRVCRYRWWGSCCSWKTIREGYSCTKYRCRGGWTHNGNQVCNIPVCWPSCKNGGSCISPGVCNCPVEFTGYRCDSATCSHLAPCYPGTCLATDGCDCSSGFTNSVPIQKQNYCLKIEDNSYTQLDMYQMQVRLSFWPRYKDPPMELHSLLADSTDMSGDQKDSFWTNRRDFNRLETTCSSQYFPPDLTGKPPYINSSTLGIVNGNVHVYLEKLGHSGAPVFRSLNKTISCERSVSNLNPETSIFNCSVTDSNFDRLLEHGDSLVITYNATGGGFRRVVNNNNGVTFNQTFTGVTRAKAVEFKFDFIAPRHCIENNPPCTSSTDMKSMLNVPDMTTSARITISWDNWSDGDSGMNRYAWEVFKMTKAAGTEVEIRPNLALRPLINQEVFASNYTTQYFTLPEPGMYSVILEAGDVANNTKYVRRLVLYDPNPTITNDPDHDFYITSASEAANYTYQNDITAPITVTWDRHFRNALHEENNLLGKVRPYPPELRDDREENRAIYRKVIPYNETKQDDWEGERTADEIPNRRGIVNFRVQHTKDIDGGTNQPDIPTGTWRDLNLNTSFTVPESPSESETVTVWVKATDAMRTEKVERRQVSFDSSSPVILGNQLKFHMNVPIPGVDFSSMFELSAKDPQSGIAHVLWTFTRTSNGSVIYQEKVPGPRVDQSQCDGFSCTCNGARQCFPHNQTLALSNCNMMVEKESLDTEVINVTADVTNMAGLVTRLYMLKDDLTKLNGTESYFPPQNITLMSLTQNSCTITWSFPPSCFRRTALWVLVNDESDKRAVHRDAREFAITGLEPGTDYQIFMVTDYEGFEQSDKAAFRFTTVEQQALSAGAAAGIGIGFIIIALLIVLIVIFCLWKRGVIFQKEGTPVNKQLHRVSRAIDTVRRTVRRDAFTNNAYKADEDEIYLYGAMAFNARQPWQLNDSSLTLMDHVADGKFASIYKASWRHDGRQDIVAAKMLKTGFTEDDAMKMMAKINFFATQLEDHDNVIKFVGAVTDNQGWGPVLVMEYCEMGQMDKWLASKRSHVTEQVMENLFRFAVGVAKGMEYLASKKLTHKRLAARNVLLTFTLDPKVAGFGPQHKQGDEEKATRVPAKWAAPEVLQEKPATEKSDVWSYGIVLWEIFSMGQVPYPNIHGSEVGARIKSGYRMDKPEFADEMYYDLMKECWQYKPSKRPTFGTIRARLAQQFGGPGNRQSVDFYYDTKQLHDLD